MKEIKAYVRRSRVNQVVNELNGTGVPGITLVEVHPVGYGYEPNYFEPGFEDVLKRYKLQEVVKLELVCADGDLNRFLDVIQRICRTGSRGDGWIFVSEITEAIRIRDGRRNDLISGS